MTFSETGEGRRSEKVPMRPKSCESSEGLVEGSPTEARSVFEDPWRALVISEILWVGPGKTALT